MDDGSGDGTSSRSGANAAAARAACLSEKHRARIYYEPKGLTVTSPVVADLLEGAEYRAADVVFEDEITLDLGGVRVRVMGVGPNHTRGDTVFFVEEDRVLFTGDVVMSVFPSVGAQSADLDKWLANLDEFESMKPSTVVPAHSRMGDIALIRRYREYLTTVRDRVAQLKGEGATVEEATNMLGEELAAEFSDLTPASGPAAGRIEAAIRAAYRM